MMQHYIIFGKGPPQNAEMHRGDNDPQSIIRDLMRKRGIESERLLAERAGVDQSALNRFMRRETTSLNSKTLQALAHCLGVTSSQLLGEVSLYKDERISTVVHAMEQLPEYLNDVLVSTSKSLLDSKER